MLTLITGGARSGKSSFAQSLCAGIQRVTYIATATPVDEEMRFRIARHRYERPRHWRTIEEPMAVPEAVADSVATAEIILVDCITLWLSNLLYAWREDDPETIEGKSRDVVAAFAEACLNTRVIAVTNEVGCGIVPDLPVARLFRDLQGQVNQRLASIASSLYLLTCGIPLQIKSSGQTS